MKPSSSRCKGDHHAGALIALAGQHRGQPEGLPSTVWKQELRQCPSTLSRWCHNWIWDNSLNYILTLTVQLENIVEIWMENLINWWNQKFNTRTVPTERLNRLQATVESSRCAARFVIITGNIRIKSMSSFGLDSVNRHYETENNYSVLKTMWTMFTKLQENIKPHRKPSRLVRLQKQFKASPHQHNSSYTHSHRAVLVV